MKPQKVWLSVPTPERWAGLGTKEEQIVPGRFEAHREALLASDPKSGELGGAVRVPAGRRSTRLWRSPILMPRRSPCRPGHPRRCRHSAKREENQSSWLPWAASQRIRGDPEWRAFPAFREREHGVLPSAPEFPGSRGLAARTARTKVGVAEGSSASPALLRSIGLIGSLSACTRPRIPRGRMRAAPITDASQDRILAATPSRRQPLFRSSRQQRQARGGGTWHLQAGRSAI